MRRGQREADDGDEDGDADALGDGREDLRSRGRWPRWRRRGDREHARRRQASMGNPAWSTAGAAGRIGSSQAVARRHAPLEELLAHAAAPLIDVGLGDQHEAVPLVEGARRVQPGEGRQPDAAEAALRRNAPRPVASSVLPRPVPRAASPTMNQRRCAPSRPPPLCVDDDRSDRLARRDRRRGRDRARDPSGQGIPPVRRRPWSRRAGRSSNARE